MIESRDLLDAKTPESDDVAKKKEESWAKKVGKTIFSVPLEPDEREMVRVAAAKAGESSAKWAARIIVEAARKAAK